MAAKNGDSPSTRKRLRLGNENGANMGLDERTRAYVLQVSDCQDGLNELNEKAAGEVLDIERKYNKLRKPLFDKRTETAKKVPNFWFKALLSHKFLSTILTGDDIDCLCYLKSLEVEDSEDIESGFWIKFYFDENPFFENDVLIKEFILGPTHLDATSIASKINWKPGKDLTKKKRVGPRKNNPLLDMELPASFFDWFLDNGDPMEDQIASMIKDDIWGNPLGYYRMDDSEEESEDEELDDEEGEDEDVDEEDEADEDEGDSQEAEEPGNEKDDDEIEEAEDEIAADKK